MATSAASNPDTALTVYYDGSCPICSREIDVYRRSRGADALDWIDVHDDAFPGDSDLDRERALARFHVRRADGVLVDGVAAFRELWSHLPAWRWLAMMTQPTVVAAGLERCYKLFLAWRNRPRAPSRSCTTMPLRLRRDLRSDHAGELGAVWIYRGILSAARGSAVRAFARRHLATEQTHLADMRALVPLFRRSLLSPIWAAAGFATGLIAALAGPNAVYVTIDTVETFVDEHYRIQISALERSGCNDRIREVLTRCHADEVGHRDEARRKAAPSNHRLHGWWTNAIKHGSVAAVRVARLV